MQTATAARRIRPLSTLLANQIAAGEVVERPASVVKELLENSLDAGAGRIELDIEQGGVGLICLRDDGGGIHRDDLALALSRHATSKIYAADELEHLRSLGFRGEALASIASVAKLSLASRSAGAEHGWRVEAEQGRPGEPVPTPHPRGTTVEVRELFYNTPGRRKFLRAERTEFGHISEVVRRIALSRFDLELVLRHNRREVLRLRPAAGETARRLQAVCGRPFVEQALQIDTPAGGLRLWGWLARPELSRSQADLQYFYVNGRMVRDKLIAHAVRQAYGDSLYPGRHPAYVLYLELDPGQVDVNVHPTKHEVRFREARLVHDFLFSALHGALAGAGEAALPAGSAGQAVAEGRGGYTPVREPAPARPRTARPFGQPLGLLHGRYILLQGEGGLVVVDGLRLRQYRLERQLSQALAGGVPRSQPLLLPQRLQLTAAQAAAVDGLSAYGFEIDRLGEQSVVVRAIPALLRGADPARLLPALLEAGEEVGPVLLARHGVEAMGRLEGSAQEELLALLAELPEAEQRQCRAELSLEALEALLGRQG